MKSKLPKDIINLEGLHVVEINKGEEFGICFKHRDGLLPAKEYYFDSKDIQNDWLRQTSEFRENSMSDQYLQM